MRFHSSAIFCFSLIMLVLASSFAFVAAEYSFAVKSGDYIVWKTTIEGRPIRNVTGARMDILDVDNEFAIVRISISTYYANGTVDIAQSNLNLRRGILADDLIIPRNLNVGDQFYDQYVRDTNITISSMGHMNFGGATRTVIFATVRNTSFTWDRETGVLVNATSSYSRGTYKSVINTQMTSTNIWQPDILGIQPTLFYEVVIGAVISAVAIGVVVGAFRAVRGRKERRVNQLKGIDPYWQRELESAD
jgi:hypothetical protein